MSEEREPTISLESARVCTTPVCPKGPPTRWNSPEHLSEVVHRIGHDIGNPLTAIISLASIIEFTSALLESNSSDPSQNQKPPPGLKKEKLLEYAHSMTTEAWKISHLNERLVMIFSQRIGNKSACSLGEVAEKVLQRLRTRHHLDDLVIESDFFFAPTATRVLADTDQLFLMICELLLNAYTFQCPPPTSTSASSGSASSGPRTTPSPIRRVQCALREMPPVAELRFTNLLPLPYEGDLADLFEPLSRGINGHHQAFSQRTGLGLSAVWSIVHRHQGALWIQQEPSGSEWKFTVVVQLPLADIAEK